MTSNIEQKYHMETDGYSRAAIPMHIVERLIILGEECSEVQQVISKILRFGLDTERVKDPFISNRDHLALELGDLQYMIDSIIRMGIVSQEDVDTAYDLKEIKIPRWTAWTEAGKRNYNSET